ncbi:MAG: ATP-binding cassette domain-containing protein [Campylobacterales bacterium]|nr:ATP-binding cassette domain-containing protein [Campylobacterales bacterium]
MIKIDIKKDLHGSNGLMKLEINLEIKEGEFLAISGLSGSGKTTLLRILAGLEEAEGFISVNNEIWLDKKFKLKVQKRGIGFVFQDYALFSNMSILENLLYIKKDKDLANKLLSMTRLKELENRMPITLSGGQKQRVALCRALMSKPKLLLLDEPLSALDSKMREKLQKDILSFHKEFNLTTIMVSHDVSEIYKLSSKLVVLENGKIINEGNAKDILLKTQGSQKFSFEGEILEIKKVDVIYIAVISISQQLVEVVITKEEASILKVSQKITLGTKAFSPTIK